MYECGHNMITHEFFTWMLISFATVIVTFCAKAGFMKEYNQQRGTTICIFMMSPLYYAIYFTIINWNFFRF